MSTLQTKLRSHWLWEKNHTHEEWLTAWADVLFTQIESCPSNDKGAQRCAIIDVYNFAIESDVLLPYGSIANLWRLAMVRKKLGKRGLRQALSNGTKMAALLAGAELPAEDLKQVIARDPK
jgi:hypothetical protein